MMKCLGLRTTCSRSITTATTHVSLFPKLINYFRLNTTVARLDIHQYTNQSQLLKVNLMQ